MARRGWRKTDGRNIWLEVVGGKELREKGCENIFFQCLRWAMLHSIYIPKFKKKSLRPNVSQRVEPCYFGQPLTWKGGPKKLFSLFLTKRTFRPTSDQEVSAQVRTFSAKARPKSPFRPKGGRKHPFRPARGRRGASFDFFSPLFAIVFEFAIKCVIVF